LLEEDPPEILVAAGECDTSWLPQGLPTDVSDAEAAELVSIVEGWMGRRSAPGLDVAVGVAFAKSEDDVGSDPPYPSFLGRDAERACGRNALWLREYARTLIQVHASPDMGDGVTCTENVCCYEALGEYDSSGTFVFLPGGDDEPWSLRAVAFVADNGTLGEEWVEAERAWVTAALARGMRGRCAGEPRVVW
jgi:hypothetical protein